MQGEQVMEAPGTALSGNAVSSFQSLANFGRFNVLKDIKFAMGNPNMAFDGTNIEQNGIQKPFSLTYNFKKPVEVHFNSTNGGTIADIVDHSFHVIVNVSNAVIVPQLSYESRVVYCE